MIFSMKSNGDFEYLRRRGLSVVEANAILLIAAEYARPGRGKWNNNT